MFPLHDENTTSRPPVVTFLILAACVFAWIFLQGFGEPKALARSICLFGLIPGKLLNFVPADTRIQVGQNLFCVFPEHRGLYTIFTHMFMHGGWLHLISNMWFLWVFGDNVEDAMGSVRFLVFYLVCGLAAAAMQTLISSSNIVPMVGASGAIGGVMGGYARLFPYARVHTLIFLGFFITRVSLPAIVLLGYWFLIQLLAGIPSLASAGGGVAFWAHVGGFLSGLLLVNFFCHSFRRWRR